MCTLLSSEFARNATQPPHTSDTSDRLPARSPSSDISILIVGGGVAGLLAGLECWRKGHDVRILERSPSRLSSGDSFTIGPTAIRVLQKWPEMAEENELISYEPWISWHRITGEMISGPKPFELNPPKVNAGDQDSHFVLQGGERLEADMVIAADGIGSISSSVTLNHEVRARTTGFSIYRASCPIDLALADPDFEDKFPLLESGIPSGQLWLGDGVHALFGRTHDEMAWYLTYPNRGKSTESWSNMVDPETVLQTTATIEGWPEYANRLIQATPKSQIHDFKLMWREPQPCWTSSTGRVIQIGDAAHTFLPSSGNGATQGMEDAISLATCLHIAGKDNVPWATRLLGVLNHEIRNRSANAKVSQTKPVGLLGTWIWQHDPEQYAIENYTSALAHLAGGSAFHNTNIPPGYVYQPWTIDGLLKALEMGEEIVLDGDWE
ncbi:hypothetical protein N7520_000904 [Penicillium odoratum]|uniref:uncharacterized protein n=1 Tax=Penicillium odoratum TaxID=1167516 RepID=UPI0025473036|nr:uncharacterized protein N7520_000904 [Penicillium odoratum]KAJ5777658.1 hypothetical protein N7520_000904 [Penicillium odoratum]